MNLNSVIPIDDEVFFNHAEGGVYIYQKNQDVLVLNETGNFLISNVEGNSIKDVINLLLLNISADSDVSNEEIYTDCISFFEMLNKKYFLKFKE